MKYLYGRRYRKLALAALFAASGGSMPLCQAATIDLATTPLGTSTSDTTVKPNVMFILDASGSMNADYVPDQANPVGELGQDAQHAFNCRTDSAATNACARGDPPYFADRFNGLAYNPQFTYKAAVNYDGTSRGNQTNWNAVPADNYDPSVKYANAARVDLTRQFPEIGYCATAGCTNPRRNGIHNGTAFAYATPKAALPTTNITLTRNNNRVTSIINPGVHVGDVIDVVDAGNPTTGCIHRAVVVTAESANGFSYDYGDATTPPCTPAKVSFSVVGYPEPADTRTVLQTAAITKRVPALATVTVTFYNHGLIAGDVIDVSGVPNCETGANGAVVGQVSVDQFSFNSSATKAQCANGSPAKMATIKRRPANIRANLSGYPFYFTLSPTEHCADLHLTDCIASSVPTAGYTFPAYVRYCSSAALAAQAPPATIVGGQPTCVDKYVAGTFACPGGTCGGYIYPRYGVFTRGDIVPGSTFSGRANRADCAAKPSCNFNEEMTNFANWFTYYRRRIQAMKTAAGLVFQNVDERYRVGFILIRPSTPVVSATLGNCSSGTGEFVPISDFNSVQKQLFYCTFYSQPVNGGTPLRSALARVGRYYAHKTDGINSGMTIDPVQYSCQQNYALLTTDGYWKATGGAPGMDGTTPVGNQDNDLKEPHGLVSRAAGTYDGGCPDGSADTTGGCANTLADVAMYYYKTDLRDASLGNATGVLGTDVAENNIKASPEDPAEWQHMVTFTVGLADGFMTWEPEYQKALTGDFKRITDGSTGCFWSGTGICNWPVAASDTPSALDDLWHAAVNGHGTYYHASSPQSLTAGLSAALGRVTVLTGAASGGTTSSPNFTQAENFSFSSGYATADWTGTFHETEITVDNDGNLVFTEKWRAEDFLDRSTPAQRTIYTFDATAGNKLKLFQYDLLSGLEKQWLDNVCAAPARLSQCANLSPDEQATLNQGANIINFIKGSKAGAGKLVRSRKNLLGDIANSAPVFVAAPPFLFADAVPTSYATFKTEQAKRQAMVYVGGNDGMLHAFNAGTGQETWGYVPRMLMRRLPLLAELNYARSHAFFVDGSPVMMDAFFGGAWHTVLVGGLNAGGRGYYALDITNPTSPQALWEFCNDVCDIKDEDLGYSYGNPIITKRNGEWVVLLTSGYNNVSPGNGRQVLFVLRLATGEIIERLFTGTGTPDSPSGLAKAAAFAEHFQQDNTAHFVYAGDLAGKVWRFDLSTSPGSVLAMGSLTDANGKPQPVTTRPELGLIKNSRVVFIGTGRYLALSDLPDPGSANPPVNAAYQQSLYAFKDTGAPQGNLRSVLTQQVITASGDTRTSTANKVDWISTDGWFVDFNPGNASPGERVNIDPQLSQGTLTVFTNVPSPDACNIGGDSWLYQFDYQTGSYLPTAPGQLLAQKIPKAATVGFVIINVPGSKGGNKILATDAFGRNKLFSIPGGTSAQRGRRIGWRELTR
jgi:type IV pilus assembly protein PilY1